jgi:hypothetical protein
LQLFVGVELMLTWLKVQTFFYLSLKVTSIVSQYS